MKKALLYLAAIVIVCLMISLGFWQLNRAEEKLAIQQYVDQQNRIELNLNTQTVAVENLYQQAYGTGKYISDQSFLIDSQVFEESVGYHVITPFKLLNSEQIILVNSGWVPAGASRSVKPKTSFPQGALSLTGRLQKPHAKPPIWNDQTPLIQDGAWQYLSIDTFIDKSDLSVAPLILELEPSLEGVGGLKRKWQVYDNVWINRHKAYALQWFSMAVAFILICLVLELRSRNSSN